MPKAKKKPAKPKKIKAKKSSNKKRRPKKVLIIPKGYHSITPYLVVSQGANAIEFYKKAFAAKVVMRMDQPNGKVGHAELQIGDAKIMLADICPEKGSRAPESFGGSPVGIHLYIKDVDKVVARAVAAGAKLLRPVENMFYGDRTGSIEDPYGHQWYIATHIEDVSPAEMRKRAAKLFGH